MKNIHKIIIVTGIFLGVGNILMAQNLNSKNNMMSIKGGTFVMGSPSSEDWREDDETQHTVTVSDFYISKYEVTQAEYKSIIGTNPSGSRLSDNNPVDSVTWYDAINFCNKLSESENLTPCYRINGEDVTWNKNANGYRLPTESEWEYACRAGTKTPFNTENSPSPEEANYYGHYPYMIEDNYFSTENLETQPGRYRQQSVVVNSFTANKLGLFNMHGNVSEWCWDLYGDYPSTTQTNPSGASEGFLRVCRGGGWNDFAKHMRSAFRSAQSPDDSFVSRGFRVVRNK